MKSEYMMLLKIKLLYISFCSLFNLKHTFDTTIANICVKKLQLYEQSPVDYSNTIYSHSLSFNEH